MSNVWVKPFIIAHISATTYQIVFRFGSCNFYIITFHNSFLIPWVGPGVNSLDSKFCVKPFRVFLSF